MVGSARAGLSTGHGSVAAAGSFNGLVGLAECALLCFDVLPYLDALAPCSSPISETFITLENTSFAENGKLIVYNVRPLASAVCYLYNYADTYCSCSRTSPTSRAT